MKKYIKRIRNYIRDLVRRRDYFEVRYIRNRAIRGGNGWCLLHEQQIIAGPFERKAVCVRRARTHCKEIADSGGLVELRICDLEGKYTAEGSTYGADPADIPG